MTDWGLRGLSNLHSIGGTGKCSCPDALLYDREDPLRPTNTSSVKGEAMRDDRREGRMEKEGERRSRESAARWQGRGKGVKKHGGGTAVFLYEKGIRGVILRRHRRVPGR